MYIYICLPYNEAELEGLFTVLGVFEVCISAATGSLISLLVAVRQWCSLSLSFSNRSLRPAHATHLCDTHTSGRGDHSSLELTSLLVMYSQYEEVT